MITLSTDQQNATDDFLKFLCSPRPGEMVIRGKAGVGKSFLTKHLIKLAHKSSKMLRLIERNSEGAGVNIHLTATTNKAAKVLSDMSGEEATTIHSLLHLKVFNNYRTGQVSIKQTRDFEPIHNTLIIVDEASMMDSELLKILRRSCKECKIVYIMDKYQLAPIGESDSPVESKVKNISTLSTIHRQKTILGTNTNQIIDLAEGYRAAQDGELFPKIIADGKIVTRVTGSEFKALVAKEFSNIDHDVSKAKILAWRNATVNQYNAHIRALHTSSDKFLEGEFVTTNKHIPGKPPYRTDQILQVRRISVDPILILDIEAWRIDTGDRYIYIPINPQELKVKRAIAAKKAKKSGDWTKYFEYDEKFADLRPVYASTIHKAQGSTHDTIFLNLTDIGKNNNRMEVAKLVYTGITRAAKRIFLYGKLGERYGD